MELLFPWPAEGAAYPGSPPVAGALTVRLDARLNPLARAAALFVAEDAKSALDVASNPLTGAMVGGAEVTIALGSMESAVPPATEAIAPGVADSLGGAG